MGQERVFLVFASVIALGINVIVQIIFCQVTRGERIYRTILAGLTVGLVAVLAFTMLALKDIKDLGPNDEWAYLVLNALCYVSLGYGYFQFISLNVNSLRIRVAKELLAAGGRKPIETLLGEYNADRVIETRLQRLTDSDQLVVKAGRYFSGKNSIFLTIGIALNAMRWFVLGKAYYRQMVNNSYE